MYFCKPESSLESLKSWWRKWESGNLAQSLFLIPWVQFRSIFLFTEIRHHNFGGLSLQFHLKGIECLNDIWLKCFINLLFAKVQGCSWSFFKLQSFLANFFLRSLLFCYCRGECKLNFYVPNIGFGRNRLGTFFILLFNFFKLSSSFAEIQWFFHVVKPISRHPLILFTGIL